MGSLNSIPLSELVSSLEILSRLEVTPDDIQDIRVYPEFAKELADLIVQRRKKINVALGRDESWAQMAIKELSDRKLLVYIAKWARLESAAEAAMRKLPHFDLSEIARKHDDLGRVKVAGRVLPARQLKLLLADSSIKGKRREVLVGELAAGYY